MARFTDDLIYINNRVSIPVEELRFKFSRASGPGSSSENVSMSNLDRTIHLQATVNAPVAEVWKAWTTPEGVKSFFAPECKVDLRLGGLMRCTLIRMTRPAPRLTCECK